MRDRRADLNPTGGVLLYPAAPPYFPPAVAAYYGDPLVSFLAAIPMMLLGGGTLRQLPGAPAEWSRRPATPVSGTNASFPRTARAAMAVLMQVGRIEVVPVLVHFIGAVRTA